jgi:hypothetical protein
MKDLARGTVQVQQWSTSHQQFNIQQQHDTVVDYTINKFKQKYSVINVINKKSKVALIQH